MIQLPIDDALPKILETLKSSESIVVTAAPGAGKTTRLPARLIEISDKKVMVLEPRRIAATAAAQRIAEENQWTLGDVVGFQVRFENQTNSKTRIHFITEALLTRKMIQDPELSDVGIVVIDEFHERSLHTDLALGLIFELQQTSRPDLKIVIMSATMNAQAISKYLRDCPIVEVSGVSFPLTIQMQNESQLINTGPNFIDHVVLKTKKHSLSAAGDTLVFLPGVGEISRVRDRLETWVGEQKVELHTLYGSMSLHDQRQTLKKSNRKKIILATNVAESALTIDGVTCVIDSGLERSVSLNTNSTLPKIHVTRISKASAKQRAGRAARQEPGEAFQLWNKLDELSMPDFAIAEIFRTDLSESLLMLSRLGIKNFSSFSWFETPPGARLQLAQEQLKTWGAIDSQGNLTEVGNKMSQLPLHPRLARIMIEGENLGVSQFAAELCAILSEKDFLNEKITHDQVDSDLAFRWEIFNENRNQDRFRSHLKLAQSISRNQNNKTKPNLDLIPRLLLPAYCDLLCHRRSPGNSQAVKIDGSGVRLSDSSRVKTAEFFLALQLMEGTDSRDAKVSLASAVPRELIFSLYSKNFHEETQVSFDANSQKLMKASVLKFGKMPVQNSKSIPLTEAELEKHLPEAALAQWDWLLRENEELRLWFDRFDWFWRQSLPFPVPEFEESQKRQALEEACYGLKKIQELATKNLVFFFENQLGSELRNYFRESCPASLKVPTGNNLKLKYFSDKNPVLEVRLQEVFGWNETPKIFDGKVAVTLHLLAPNYRPIQVTQDLANFWRGAYQEVRKQLRAKYPKHSWPDDPLTAKPIAKGRSQK